MYLICLFLPQIFLKVTIPIYRVTKNRIGWLRFSINIPGVDKGISFHLETEKPIRKDLRLSGGESCSLTERKIANRPLVYEECVI